jgi:hypothetical protein
VYAHLTHFAHSFWDGSSHHVSDQPKPRQEQLDWLAVELTHSVRNVSEQRSLIALAKVSRIRVQQDAIKVEHAPLDTSRT